MKSFLTSIKLKRFGNCYWICGVEDRDSRRNKKRQATYITPLRPFTFAAFPPWRIQQELVV